MQRLVTTDVGFDAKLRALLAHDVGDYSAIDATVAAILAQVKNRGDAALLEYTAQFDHLSVSTVAALEVAPSELQDALARIPAIRREALAEAVARVREYHLHQRSESWRYTDFALVGGRPQPLRCLRHSIKLEVQQPEVAL